jgi:dihydroneopterin aldolase
MEPEHKLTIELSGLRFFGHYGLYPVEANWNTEITVDLSIEMKSNIQGKYQLQDTIDYAELYKIIEIEMKQEHQLLETIANKIAGMVKKYDDRIELCKVRLSKKPQLGGPSEKAVIEIEY